MSIVDFKELIAGIDAEDGLAKLGYEIKKNHNHQDSNVELLEIIAGMQMMKIEIINEDDIILARQKVRELADEMEFSVLNKTRLATAVSEIARNVFVHGGAGYMEIGPVEQGDDVGVSCIFQDNGPGIDNISDAMSDGFTTTGSLGRGLPGTKRLVDVFTISSTVGQGTTVELIKWR